MGAPVPILLGQLGETFRLQMLCCLHHEEIAVVLPAEHQSSRQVHEALAFGL